MKRMFGFFITCVVLAAPTTAVHAEDRYADGVVDAGWNLLSPEKAVGAPDGAYADFRAEDASVTLDMGADVVGDLWLTVYLLQSGAGYSVTFYNATWDVVATDGAVIPLATTNVVAESIEGVGYRYVEITSIEGEQWRLDAVMATSVAVEEEEVVGEETPAEETPAASHTVGTLLKTDESSAVYILGSDGMRHAFPTEREFMSWGLSFDSVLVVSVSTLAAYDLGDNVTMRPGTYLVKLQASPNVFAVEPGGVLRWITTADLARELYGTLWESRLVDVSDAFWANYSHGEDIVTTVHPDGTLLQKNSSWYYVADGTKAALSSNEEADQRFIGIFVISDVDPAIFEQYATGVASLMLTGAQWPY